MYPYACFCNRCDAVYVFHSTELTLISTCLRSRKKLFFRTKSSYRFFVNYFWVTHLSAWVTETALVEWQLIRLWHCMSFPVNWTFFFLWPCCPTRAMAPSFMKSLDHTQRRITVGRTPLDEWSACRKDLYLTTHNTHNKQPCPRWDSNPRSQQASGRRPTP